MERQTLKIYAGGGGGCDGGAAPCAGGTCPTVYQSSEGKFFVQGYRVSKEIEAQVPLAENETLVEVSPELIANVAKQAVLRPE